MGQILTVILIAIVIIVIEVPSLRKKGLIRELWVFSVLLVIGVMLNVAEVLRMKIPNPLDFIAYVYKPLSDLIYGSLK
jgi:hypothetical protein